METTKVALADNGFGEVQLFSDDIKAGKMDISVAGKLLTVYHTEVDETYSGRGFGKILLTSLVTYARTNNLLIKPLCPYVHLQFRRHEADYADIWYKEQNN